MQSSGTVTVNGTTYTIGNTYSFKGSVQGRGSADGSNGTAASLDELSSMAADYKNNFYPKMVLKFYDEGNAYPYCLYYPTGFWGGGVHGWFKADIFQASGSGGGGSGAETQTITPPLGGSPKTYKKLKGRYKKNGAYITAVVFYKENDEWIKGGPFIKGSGTWK